MISIKPTVRKWTPAWLRPGVLLAYRKWQEVASSEFDRREFSSSRFRSLRSASKEQLEGKLIFHAHSLEKGLSHADFRFNSGKAALQSINASLEAYRSKQFPQDGLPYLNALATLREYLDKHRDAGVNPVVMKSIFSTELLSLVEVCESRLGGAELVNKSDPDGGTSDFRSVLSGRRSVREFADQPVGLARILPAIEMATRAPSVCNRQSSRVKVVTDRELIGPLLEIQGGMAGYALPPALLVVTSDASSFLEPTERNQPFVDGGLFAMCLLLALEYNGLASCPLNTMMPPSKEKQVRTILGLDRAERLVVFIAVGEFSSGVLVPKSFRVPVKDIVTEY